MTLLNRLVNLLSIKFLELENGQPMKKNTRLHQLKKKA